MSEHNTPRGLTEMADKLAEAIRSHGPWMDDKCAAVLAEYDALIAELERYQERPRVGRCTERCDHAAGQYQCELMCE